MAPPVSSASLAKPQPGKLCKEPSRDSQEDETNGKDKDKKVKATVIKGCVIKEGSYVLGKPANGGMVQGGVNRGDGVSLRLIHLDGGDAVDGVEAVGSINAQINNGAHGEGRLVTSQARAEEMLDGGVCRHDLIKIGGSRG